MKNKLFIIIVVILVLIILLIVGIVEFIKKDPISNCENYTGMRGYGNVGNMTWIEYTNRIQDY